VGFLVGFTAVFLSGFKKTGDLFWLGPITITLKIIVDV